MRPPKKRVATQAATKSASFSGRFPNLCAAALLSAVTLAAFSNSFATGFVFDSKQILLQDPRIRQATAENIGLIFQHTYWWPYGEAGLYRPFTTLSYLWNYAILGNRENPAGYHWVNFLLHTANVWLVYLLASRLLRRYWPAMFLAVLWAVHPLLTESVTNLVGRADLFAGTAVLGGLWIYLKSAEASGGRRLGWLLALAIVATLGFFAKESAVVLIGAIALFEFTWWSDRKRARALILAGIALLAPLEAMLYQRAAVLSASPKADFPFTDNPIMGAGFWAGKLTALKVLAHYLWLTIWPLRLSADYSYSQIPIVSGTWRDWLAWCAVAGAAVGIVCLYRVHRTAFFLACFAVVTILPSSNLLFPIGSIMAERFMYLPSIGLVGCLVLAVFAAGQRIGNPRLAPAVLGAIACAFAARTWARNLDWQDDVTLDRATVRSAPLSFKAHKMLAVSLMEADPGDSQIDRELDEARQSMELVDSLPDSRNDPAIYRLAATLYVKKGDGLQAHDSEGRPVNTAASTDAYRRAMAALERQIAILQAIARQNPDAAANPAPEFVTPEAGHLLSVIYERLGDTGKAMAAAVQARIADPLNPVMYRQLAHVFLDGGHTDDAAAVLMEGMIVTEDMGIRSDLVKLYQSGIDTKGCALQQGPGGPAINPACPMIHAHLCSIAVDSIRVRLATGRKDIAEQLRRSFVNDYGCPADPIDQAMNQKPGS
jgi:protein O-mannosyl-transferase